MYSELNSSSCDSLKRQYIQIYNHHNFEIKSALYEDSLDQDDLYFKVQGKQKWSFEEFKFYVDQIKIFKNITSLSLEIMKSSNLKEEYLKYLGQILVQFIFLQKISIAIHQDNWSSIKYAKQILNSLEWLPKLKSFSLTLEQNDVGYQAIQEITEYISRIPYLIDLSLIIRTNNIDKSGAQAIGITLYKKASLERLNLVIGSNNKIGYGLDKNVSLDNICDNISEVFSQYLKKTRVNLRLQKNHSDPSKTHGIHSIARSFQNLQSLKTLKLTIDHDNNLNVIGCTRLSEGLCQLINLRELQLTIGKNDIQSKGIQDICNSISQLANLTSLDLKICHSNQMYSDGAISLGNTLKKLSNLTHFSLNVDSRNNIGEFGAIGLGEGIKQLANLVFLKLLISWQNKISAKGSIAIANSLIYLQKLQALDLQFDTTNDITEIGSDALGVSLNSFKQLKYVNIKYEQPKVHKKVVLRKNIRLINLKVSE
ncbi:hypothetical protein ABPG72_003388 [Tetrahymena utriculariae]